MVLEVNENEIKIERDNGEITKINILFDKEFANWIIKEIVDQITNEPHSDNYVLTFELVEGE
jgi:hypothetical protein